MLIYPRSFIPLAALFFLLFLSRLFSAEILLDEDFESADAEKALKMATTPSSLTLVDRQDDERAGGRRTSGPASTALRIHEHPEKDREPQIGSGYKPAAEMALAAPSQPGQLELSFDFKQMSGDTSGLSFDLLDLSGAYKSWIRITIGLDQLKIMKGKTLKPGGLSNGPDSDWHHFRIVLPYPGVAGPKEVTVQVDDTALPAAKFGSIGSPKSLTHLRFSNEGLGPDFYYIDNVKLTVQP